MIYQLVVAIAVASVASANLYKEDPTHLKQMWDNFKREWNRQYSTMDEESTRFQNFVQNLKNADARNKQESGAGAVHGITKFSDLSQAEFESRFLTADASEKTSERTFDTTERVLDTTAGLVDWSGKLTTPVKDQGYCGSCWAFSAVEQIESDAIRTLGYSSMLSPQQVTSCDNTSAGCGGGWTESAYKYVQKAGGLETEANYPYSTATYQGATGTCKADKSKFEITVTGFTTLKSESSMASYVQGTGPLSVCVDATTWNSYNGGIMTSCGTRINHCVQAVGVDTASYWKVRNSWGTSWGESGYIRLAYGKNTCGITNDPTYATVKKV